MSGKAALVTGASSGIGLNYAKALTAYGYDLILVSNHQEQLAQTVQMLVKEHKYCYTPADSNDTCTAIASAENSSPHVFTLCSDLARQEAAQELFDYCNESGFEVEVLINNAGIFIFNDIADCTPDRVTAILNLHMNTITLMCRLFGEKMRKRRKGYILNMSSLSAHTPYPGISLYASTKSFIRTMSIALSLEMKEYGVRVMVVSPGAVATDLYNLPANLQQLGMNIGVIYPPAKLAKRALHKLFCTNKKEYIPGFVNRLFKPIYAIIPIRLKLWGREKLKRFMR